MDPVSLVAAATFGALVQREVVARTWINAGAITALAIGLAALDVYGGTSVLWFIGIVSLTVIGAAAFGWLFKALLLRLCRALDGAAGFGRTEEGERTRLRMGFLTVALKGMPLTAAFGLLVLLGCVILLVFAEWIAPYGEREIVSDGVWDPASAAHWLGTDNLGRDMLSRLIYGAQTTIAVALAASVMSFAIGMILSFTAAVTGGWVDQVLSRVNDLLLAIPTLIFALVVLAALPQNIIVLVLVMALIDQTRVYRLGRAVAIDVAVQDFVEAARLRGEGWGWIIFREILPNVWTPLIAEFGLRFAFAVLFLSTLSFLGLGIQPPEADWGGMVKDNSDGIIFLVPAALYPGAAIAGLAVCVNMVVDWLLNRTASLKGGRG